MSWPTVLPPHPPAWREVLRKAGMSENSELTADEASGIRSALVALAQNSRIDRNRLYRIIRPRKDDDE